MWATEEQRDWFAETAPHYVSAMLLGGEEGFWESVREQWFRRWPIAPQLVERGLLPPGVLQEGHVLTETEAEMVNIKEWEHMKVRALSWEDTTVFSQASSVFASRCSGCGPRNQFRRRQMLSGSRVS